MSEQEMRELDAWIGEHLFGGTLTRTPHLATDIYMQTAQNEALMMSPFPLPRYTSDAHAAMMVLEKCADKCSCIEIWNQDTEGNSGYSVIASRNPEMQQGTAETLPLAICLFAKKLFI